MNRRHTLGFAAAFGMGFAVLAGSAFAQQPALKKEQIAGAWAFASAKNVLADGKTFDPTNGKGTGILVFDPSGHFSWQIIHSDIVKVASNNRLTVTAEEAKSVAQGVLSYFGTYSIPDDGKSLVLHIEHSTFANFNGTDSSRTITLAGDELTVSNASGASGGSASVTWKKLK